MKKWGQSPFLLPTGRVEKGLCRFVVEPRRKQIIIPMKSIILLKSCNMNGYLKYVIENCEVALAELRRINGELRAGMSPDSTADVNRLGAYNRMIQDYLIVRIAGLFDKDTRTISFANSFAENPVVESARSEEIIKYILRKRNKFIAHSEKKSIEAGDFPETDKICNSNLSEILEKLKALTIE